MLTIPTTSGSSDKIALQSWSYLVAGWIGLMILLGGGTKVVSAILWTTTGTSMLILAVSLVKLRGGFPTQLSMWGAVLAFLSLGLVLIQLVPLPYDFWASLAGRQLFAEVIETTGLPQISRPLSVNPAATWQSAISILPALAAFFAALTLSFREYHRVFAAILICAFIGLIIGLLQRFYGEASGLYFYGQQGGRVLGTFINRNNFAAQLFVAIPILTAFAVFLSYKAITHPVIIVIFTFIFGGALIAGLAATGSRAGTVLAMLAALLSVAFVFRRPSRRSNQRKRVGLSLVVTLGVLLIMAQASMIGILRLIEADPLDDYRSVMFDIGLKTSKTFFPVGSGFGTFSEVYEMHEISDVIYNKFVNHAHNDWLELVIEGGVPAIILMIGFVVLLAVCTVQIIRRGSQDIASGYLRAALVVIILLMAHSFVDFSLRKTAHLVVFAFCCGIICMATAEIERWRSNRHGSAPKIQPKRELRPFSRPERGFVSRSTGQPTL